MTEKKIKLMMWRQEHAIYGLLSQFVTNEWKSAIEERKFINSDILNTTLKAFRIPIIGPPFKAV